MTAYVLLALAAVLIAVSVVSPVSLLWVPGLVFGAVAMRP